MQLPFTVTHNKIREVFSMVGLVDRVKLPTTGPENRPAGYGIVIYNNILDALQVIASLIIAFLTYKFKYMLILVFLC